jgi:hypothetical protein
VKMLQRIFLLQCPDPLQRSAAILDERLRQHLRLGIRREEDALARLCGVVCGGASCKR